MQPGAAARWRRARIEALCACGTVGLSANAAVDPDRVLAAVLVGALSRRGEGLLIDASVLPSIELHAVPETDWLAWDRLCALLPDATPAGRARDEARRLVRFERCPGLLPDCRDVEARCDWTRCWLGGAALSAAATPREPRSGW